MTYNEGQLRTIEVLQEYYALESKIFEQLSETMTSILDLHKLKDTQGWEKSDELFFQSLVYQWESLKQKRREIIDPLESAQNTFNQN